MVNFQHGKLTLLERSIFAKAKFPSPLHTIPIMFPCSDKKISHMSYTLTTPCMKYFLLTHFRSKYEEIFAAGSKETISQ